MPTAKELMIEELFLQQDCDPTIQKDILIVVRNQFDYFKKCVESVFANTSNFNLYIWDNGSDSETENFIQTLKAHNTFVHSIRAEGNLGFIVPNNRLAQLGSSPYIILLNSDTEVQKGWDTAMLGYLKSHPEVGAVGYEGGFLSAEGMGVLPWKGPEVDYIMGWCLAISRDTHRKYGLFDEKNLSFAYGEDADFCLRLREGGLQVYALCINFVLHHACVTTRQVRQEMNFKVPFLENHKYMKKRWSGYLAENRNLLKYPDIDMKKLITPEELAENYFPALKCEEKQADKDHGRMTKAVEMRGSDAS